MIRRLFALLCVLLPTSAFGFVPNLRVVQEIRRADSLEVQAEKTAKALDVLFRVACWQVEKNDPQLAFAICSDWIETYRPMVARLGTAEGIGDHEPVSAWLAVATLMIRESIGDTLFFMLRLNDLDTFNFGIKVAFSPSSASAWCVETITETCRDEYLAHANPLMGATGYWLANLSCSFASAGALVLICSPIGRATELVIMNTVGPKISYRIYDRANPE